MKPFTQHRGIVAPLNRANVDTDQIIPKQFLKSIKRTGFGPSAFFDWRYDKEGELNPNWEYNHPRYHHRSILVTRNNFGCGSSREHAVWALAQDGLRAIIAPYRGTGDGQIPGFADIFKNNCAKNGLVTVELSEDEVEEIFQTVYAEEGLEATVDLPGQKLIVHAATGDTTYSFDYDSSNKDKLIRGLDDIEETLQYEDAISRFEENHETWI
ncbi:3-isopropylmalate dehydratase small subunit [Chitinivibrio alkaliphilus]|uniref:3-isopropylmalate dehydratase small subunit n=1 Tax=Chitinivibrio alkaliphilus ACht1 TaxID=1313304 RepID=U7DE82_9BACT|nr:3-isopropylmalate dehydratase small subunit [Chitinivibrio alkaliphilus]ERP39231.1 3-isopropylmalate dehydratase small subunit [Chitinivibrio alkaliphilus ACht1]